MEKFLGKSAADKSQNKARVECCPRMEESCLASSCQAVEHSQSSTRSVLSCMIYAVRLVHRTPLQYKYQIGRNFRNFIATFSAIFPKCLRKFLEGQQYVNDCLHIISIPYYTHFLDWIGLFNVE